MTTNDNAVILYQSADGAASLEVRLDHETVWLTQKQMAELFGKNSDTIGLHIRNAYKEGELVEDGTTEESSVVQIEGSRRIQRKIRFSDDLIPQSKQFRHSEGNSDSHLKASFYGSSVQVILRNGKMWLGTWQGIYFCEFDGPRKRKLQLAITS